MLAEAIAQWDTDELIRTAAKLYHWTPQQLWAMTPHEIHAIFGVRHKGGNNITPDERHDLLRKANEARAKKGLRPIAPSWLHPHLRPHHG